MIFEETITRLSELAANLPQDQCGSPAPVTSPPDVQNLTETFDSEEAAASSWLRNSTGGWGLNAAADSFDCLLPLFD